MIDTRNQEIDIEEIVSPVHEKVEQYTLSDDQAAEHASSSDAQESLSAEVLSHPSIDLQPLTFQSDFRPHTNDRYHINDLLGYHDQPFVRNAHLAILKRQPKDAELHRYVDDLRSGRTNKVAIIESLLSSAEGQAHGVKIEGMPSPVLRRLTHIPVLGYLLRLVKALLRVPVMMEHQQQFEAYSLAQQQRIADHINMAVGKLIERQDTSPSAITKLSEDIADTSEAIAMLSEGLADASSSITTLSEDLTSTSATVSKVTEHLTDTSEAIAMLSDSLAELSTTTAELQEIRPELARQQQQIEALAAGSQELIMQEQSALQEHIREFAMQEQSLIQELVIQEQSVIVETQKVALAELQDQLNDLYRKQQQIYVELALREQRLKSLLDNVSKYQDEPSDEQASRITVEAEHHRLDGLFAAFENQFRGDPADIKERLRIYLPLIKEAQLGTDAMPILDVGCGRGEWLELLREEGLQARGVDTNQVLVEQCHARGLDVAAADVLTHLHALPDASLGAVTGFHIIEHLRFPDLIEMMDETLRVLKSGGLAIFETPNPKNLVVGACNFYSDPTHRKPIYPETIQFLLSHRGFARVRLEYLHPVESSPFDQLDQGTQALHGWFYGPRDFAVIGSKA